MPETNWACLIKGKESFGISCEVGCEGMALHAMLGMMNNPDLNFNLFDIRALSIQLGPRHVEELRRYMQGLKMKDEMDHG